MADLLDPNDPSRGQTLIEHLTELRVRLVKAAWAIAVATLLCWLFHNDLFELVRRPIVPYLDVGGLVFTHPIDKFMAHLKVAVIFGVALSCPFWLYQAWQFVSPGLYAHEKKYSVMFIASGTILFAIGVSFAYFLVLPAAFQFLLRFGGTEDKAMITIGNHLSFVMTMMMVFGLAFELPLVIVVLGAIGLVDQKFLREKRRIMIVVLAVVSALVTPPDALSMLMLLVPLIVLYEISILLVGSMGKKRQPAG